MCEARMERVTGIEPAWPAWKAGALPLSYTRVTAKAIRSIIALAQCGTGPHCTNGRGGEIRTRDLLLPKQAR